MILRASNLRKGYAGPDGKALEIIRGLNLEVEKGETLSITGQSGSGKSTLLSLLGALDYPDSGSIEIDGENMVEIDENGLTKFRARKIGFVFQQFFLMPHLNTLENVTLPLEIAGEADVADRAREALESTGLSSRLKHYPRQLSGGECQRVAIARALVTRPSLLLADEPTGNLDVGIGNKISDQLFELVAKSGMTMILVTHNRELAKSCGRALNLVEGRFQ